MIVKIRPGRDEDHNEIIARMRRIEWCSKPESVKSLLERAWHFEVALADEKIAAAWGVTGDFIGPTIPWLLTTDIVERYPIRFLKESRRQLLSLGERFGQLDGYVEADYAKSIRWLEWLGARLGGEELIGTGVKARTFSWQ